MRKAAQSRICLASSLHRRSWSPRASRWQFALQRTMRTSWRYVCQLLCTHIFSIEATFVPCQLYNFTCNGINSTISNNLHVPRHYVGMGSYLGRCRCWHSFPLWFQCRIVEGTWIVHRGRCYGTNEKIFTHCRGWSSHPLLLIRQREFGHVGAQCIGCTLTTGWCGSRTEKRVGTKIVAEFIVKLVTDISSKQLKD